MYTHVELSKFWGSNIQSYGVAWGDFNTDGIMRLVAVGESRMRGCP
jgi:hypothetical protein